MKTQTYEVHCKQGLNREICPIIKKNGMHCVECGHVFYIQREIPDEPEEAKKETEQKDND